MRFKIHVEAFGWTWDKEWGDASHTIKIGEGAFTILTIGLGFWLYI
jgi:hypothetical protein